MRFAICNEIFQDWKLEDTFEFVASAGYDAIEIAPFTIGKSVNDISPEKRQEIKRLSTKYKLPVSAIHWVLVQTEGLHLTHRDEAVRRKTGKYFCDLVDFCADI